MRLGRLIVLYGDTQRRAVCKNGHNLDSYKRLIDFYIDIIARLIGDRLKHIDSYPTYASDAVRILQLAVKQV